MLRNFVLFIAITLFSSVLTAQQSIPNISLKTINGVKIQSNEVLNETLTRTKLTFNYSNGRFNDI